MNRRCINGGRAMWQAPGARILTAAALAAMMVLSCSAVQAQSRRETWRPAGQRPTDTPASERAASAEPPANPHVWEPRVTSVSVFKNGLGFFMREGDVTLRDGWAVANHIPPALFGTLAIFAHSPQQMVSIVGSGPGEIVDFDGIDAPTDVAAKRQRLADSENLNVQLTYRHGTGQRQAAGALRSVDDQFAILESDGHHFAVPIADVTRMQILGMPLRVRVENDAENNATDARLGMAYLRKGITWIPEYTLTIIDDSTAELVLRGTLVNEAEDLIDCEVNFMVGVPHFTHTDYMAPLSVGQVIRTIGSAVAPQQVQTQIMNRAAIASNGFGQDFEVVSRPVDQGGRSIEAALGNLPQIGMEGGSDYTVYRKDSLTLRRGERAIVTLFRRTINYSHVYRWQTDGPMRHMLVLHNNTSTSWTTGPYLAVSGGRPLSQDLLRYTPAGGSGEVPVTTAINIAHQRSEEIIDRQLKAHSPRTNVFLDLVTVRGEVRLRNFEQHPARVVITSPVPGRPLEASDNGTTSGDTQDLRLQHLSGTVRWEIELRPGESRTLTYTYERYVSSE